MNFHRRLRASDEPEINLIPFIDVLLVVLIFLMLSTTYSKFTEMQIRLPVADTDVQKDRPKELIVAVSSQGDYVLNRQSVSGRSVDSLAAALASATQGGGSFNIIISADAAASHQSVITVMEAARRSGLNQITFAAQSSARGAQR